MRVWRYSVLKFHPFISWLYAHQRHALTRRRKFQRISFRMHRRRLPGGIWTGGRFWFRPARLDKGAHASRDN